MGFLLVPPVVRIEIPALDRLITHLEQQNSLQAEMDALTAKLNQSSDALEGALGQHQQQKKET